MEARGFIISRNPLYPDAREEVRLERASTYSRAGFGTSREVISIADEGKDRALKLETLALVLRVVRFLIELL